MHTPAILRGKTPKTLLKTRVSTFCFTGTPLVFTPEAGKNSVHFKSAGRDCP